MKPNSAHSQGEASVPADKNRPLQEDIRWLGRLLGDTVRAQQGQAAFDLIETIRRTSVQFRLPVSGSAMPSSSMRASMLARLIWPR